MGFILPNPNPDSPMEQARTLMAQKDTIEAELDVHVSVLKANNVTMSTPLVDQEGFPRADIDIYAVRSARKRINELRNDLKAVMDAIAKSLETIYARGGASAESSGASDPVSLKPFAKVEAISPGSPAVDAALQRGDLVVKFGDLDENSFKAGSLQPLADLVAKNEDRAIGIRVLRDGRTEILTLTPRKNWGGRGMLGCYIVPYVPS